MINHPARTRVICYLTREQCDELDKIGKDALFTTGNKIPRSTLLGMWAELLRRLKISGSDIYNAEQFYERVLDQWQAVATKTIKS